MNCKLMDIAHFKKLAHAILLLAKIAFKTGISEVYELVCDYCGI
jgi:hypothetical protein